MMPPLIGTWQFAVQALLFWGVVFACGWLGFRAGRAVYRILRSLWEAAP